MDAKIKAWLEQLYQSNKFFFYSVVPLTTIILGVIKYRSILINLIIGSSKKGLESANKADAALATQADQAEQQANTDVANGDAAASKETPTGDDWNIQ
jgi:hypothetical protein